MSEELAISKSTQPITLEILKRDLKAIGINQGDVVLVHSSLSSLGWVCGGAQSVIMALMDVIGPQGTLVMPSHSGDWTDPKDWHHPPVPDGWIEIIKATMPAYDPFLTRTRGMGVIAELFRLQKDVLRSSHPHVSFCAYGPLSQSIIQGHSLFPQLGMNSPLGNLFRIKAKVLLLGVDYDSNTCFHLAETLLPNAPKEKNGAAMMVNGHRKWVEFNDYCYDNDDFIACGSAFEETGVVTQKMIGYGHSRLFYIHDAVKFAQSWFIKNRKI